MPRNARFGFAILVLVAGAACANAQAPAIPQGDQGIAVADLIRVQAPGTIRADGRYAIQAAGGVTLDKILVIIDYFNPQGQASGSETLTATTAANGVNFTAQSAFPLPNNAYGAKATVRLYVKVNGVPLLPYVTLYNGGNIFNPQTGK